MRALLLVLAAGCGEAADPRPVPDVAPPAVEALQQESAAQPASQPGPPSSDAFRALFGDHLELVEVQPSPTGDGFLVDARARTEGIAEIGLREPTNGEVQAYARIRVQAPGVRVLPPRDAHALLCVGDSLRLAVPAHDPPLEWVRADPAAWDATPYELLGPVPRQGDFGAAVHRHAPHLIRPHHAKPEGAEEPSLVRLEAARPGTHWVGRSARFLSGVEVWIIEPDQPLLLFLDMRDVWPLFDRMRPGDRVFLERELFEPTDPNLPIPAPSGL